MGISATNEGKIPRLAYITQFAIGSIKYKKLGRKLDLACAVAMLLKRYFKLLYFFFQGH